MEFSVLDVSSSRQLERQWTEPDMSCRRTKGHLGQLQRCIECGRQILQTKMEVEMAKDMRNCIDVFHSALQSVMHHWLQTNTPSSLSKLENLWSGSSWSLSFGFLLFQLSLILFLSSDTLQRHARWNKILSGIKKGRRNITNTWKEKRMKHVWPWESLKITQSEVSLLLSIKILVLAQILPLNFFGSLRCNSIVPVMIVSDI